MKYRNTNNKIGFCIFLLLVGFASFSNDSIPVDGKKQLVKQKIFGQIFSSFYYGASDNIEPKSAFEMPTALFGYSSIIAEKVKATLIYDVTRTTNFRFADTSGISNYFEGSKYTAFLKMAEIQYSINKNINFKIGQLLNTQYLTVQDKFWGYRYIYFTYQEVHRYGMPADFGAQLDLKYKDKIKNQISIVNGEGPFRHQDVNAQFIISNNIEVYPIDGLILKLYTDFSPTKDTSLLAKDKSVVSGFAGYKSDKYKIGLEYNSVNNYGYTENSDYFGFSGYAGYFLNDKTDILIRYDFINKSKTFNIENGSFILAGFQYMPVNNFFCSLNVRALFPEEKYWLYASFGVKF